MVLDYLAVITALTVFGITVVFFIKGIKERKKFDRTIKLDDIDFYRQNGYLKGVFIKDNSEPKIGDVIKNNVLIRENDINKL